jgi:hypothetical protein
MKRHEVTSYPADFALIVVFVDTQGLYRHMPSIVCSFPNITETAGSNGTIAHRPDTFSGDGVRNGNEVSAVAQLPKLLGYEGIKRSVPQDLYRLVCAGSCSCLTITPYQKPPTAPYPPLSASLKHVGFESGASRAHTLDIWRDILGNLPLVVDQARLRIQLTEGLPPDICQNPRATKEKPLAPPPRHGIPWIRAVVGFENLRCTHRASHRSSGSSFQQSSSISHSGSDNRWASTGSVGRAGRSPLTICQAMVSS